MKAFSGDDLDAQPPTPNRMRFGRLLTTHDNETLFFFKGGTFQSKTSYLATVASWVGGDVDPNYLYFFL